MGRTEYDEKALGRRAVPTTRTTRRPTTGERAVLRQHRASARKPNEADHRASLRSIEDQGKATLALAKGHEQEGHAPREVLEVQQLSGG